MKHGFNIFIVSSDIMGEVFGDQCARTLAQGVTETRCVEG
jgi:hypothetical protein